MAARNTAAAKKTAANRTTDRPADNGASTSSRTPRAGSVVRVKSDADNAPASYAMVVDTVSKTEHRPAGVYVVPLPNPVHLELDQVENA